jgi:cobalamin biosynthesis Mg chelatase CobN
MTALQPSDRSRFKDASEAEQALREAWERCLTQGLVHPAVLAMDEMPHDKAAARFHEARGAIARPSPLTLGDSSELTAVTDKASSAKKPNQFVIESSRGRPGDDDPTKLMIREEGKAKAEATGRVNAASKTPGPEGKPSMREQIDSVADTKSDPAMSRQIAREHSRGRPMWLVGLIIALVVLAGAGAALYFSGVFGA